MRITAIALVFLGLCTLVVADDIPGVVKDQPARGRYVKTDRGFMVPYQAIIPGTAVTYEMIPVPGGEFLLGSRESESGRKDDEGPQVLVKTRPFWMAKNELSWAEYNEYMALYRVFKEFEGADIRLVTEDNQIDAITAPTALYDPSYTFEFGDDPQFPAVAMTQYAARQYTKWLSGITGEQYRLPTEAEWEYAARAGSTTAYSYGDDATQLGDHARFKANSGKGGPHRVGFGEPNAFGLCDMHGNVAEWCQDELFSGGYSGLQLQVTQANGQPLPILQVFRKPTTRYPRVIRGGFWDSLASDCRSASRMGSNDQEFGDSDADLPKSPWWYTDDPSRGIGFRLLRSIDELPRDQIEQFWSADTDALRVDVAAKVMGGRGVHGIVDKELPEAIKTLKAKQMR
jgi:formylglycine-generating enzyme